MIFFSSVSAVPHKLLRLNKTHLKLPTCQADCKVVFSWTRTSTHLMLFPVETVLLQCHDRSGWWCPLHTPTTEAPGSVPADECQLTVEWAFKDNLSLSLRSPSVVKFIQVPPYPLQTEQPMLLSAAADLARGVESRRMGCCLLLWFSSWFVWVCYLMTPHNPSHKCPYMVSYTMPNFEALQWITLRNRVGNLSALNLYSMSFKRDIFAFGGWAFFQNAAHPFRKALCDL